MKAEGIIVNPSFVTKDNLSLFPNLKWIHLLMSGYNSVDLAEVRRRNITLTNSKDVFHIQIAEDVFTKILAINRHVKEFYQFMKNEDWKPIPDELEIYGSTVGIIGAGSIGGEIAKRMKAFEAKVIGWKRKDAKLPYYDEIYTGEDGLSTVLAKSDYVIVAIPLSKETHGLINKDRLKQMKSSALLVNIARGEIVNQEDLVDALERKVIRGAALDVTYPEPLSKNHPLWRLDNVFITPHNASSSIYMFDRMMDLTEENIRRFSRDEPLLHIVTG
jgi:D-2-hydroxyacid dehydrogenase (NADP+)